MVIGKNIAVGGAASANVGRVMQAGPAVRDRRKQRAGHAAVFFFIQEVRDACMKSKSMTRLEIPRTRNFIHRNENSKQ
jgi:hypothetical protein